MKPTQAEQFAEELFKHRQKKQIELARNTYRNQQYLLSNDAFQYGFADRKDQQHARWTMNLLEQLFGKETFRDL